MIYLYKKSIFFIALLLIVSGYAFANGDFETALRLHSTIINDGYSGSTHSLEDFGARLAEIRADNSTRWHYWGSFARSNHSLETFKSRFDEIRNDFAISSRAWADYIGIEIFFGYFAASNHSIQSFRARLDEIREEGSLDIIFWGYFAGSTHSLQTFINRVREAASSDTFRNNQMAWAYFAGSNNSLQVFIARDEEISVKIREEPTVWGVRYTERNIAGYTSHEYFSFW